MTKADNDDVDLQDTDDDDKQTVQSNKGNSQLLST